MIEKLKLDFGYKQFIENKLMEVKEKNIPVILYGAGMRSDMVSLFLKQFDIEAEAYVVSDSHYNEKINKLANKSVIKYSDLNKKYPNNILVIANDHLSEEDLKSIMANNNALDIVTPAFIGMDLEYIKENESKFEQVLNILRDEKSRETFINFLSSCLTLNSEFIRSCYSKNSYFIKEIQLSNNEVFVDAGAFNGDTLNEFMKETNNNYKKYYAFEPDEINFEKLYLKNKNLKSVYLNKIGLSYKKGFAKFDAFEGVSSRINENGFMEVPINTIDNLCKDATFIKMDIEGSEMEALIGARNVILKNKPKLAICIYHKKEHLTDIFEYIHSLIPEYNFFIRQHNKFNATELVLYAII